MELFCDIFLCVGEKGFIRQVPTWAQLSYWIIKLKCPSEDY